MTLITQPHWLFDALRVIAPIHQIVEATAELMVREYPL